MLLDLKFSILTLSITAGTFVAALYGMNLKNFIEESDLGFFGISAWCTVFGLMVATFSFTRLRKVQRVSMWGHGPGSRTGGGWGLGAWGGRSTKSIDGSLGLGRDGLRIRPGESLGELLQRERENSRRLAKAESKTEEALRFCSSYCRVYLLVIWFVLVLSLYSAYTPLSLLRIYRRPGLCIALAFER